MNEQELKKLEDKLWAATDKMRDAVSVSNYKFIVLGLIFLKYISTSFEEKYKELLEEGAGLEEEIDCYTAENIFYILKNTRWEYLVEHSKDTNIGEIIDDDLTLIEKENNSLKNVLPKNYNSPTMRNVNFGELLDLFTNIKVGTKEAKEKAFFDALGADPKIKGLMQDETLVQIAKELVEIINKNLTLDAFKREDARARIGVNIRRLLIKYNYPPVKREGAVEQVVRQAELKYANN